jgi:hypothetical protein
MASFFYAAKAARFGNFDALARGHWHGAINFPHCNTISLIAAKRRCGSQAIGGPGPGKSA